MPGTTAHNGSKANNEPTITNTSGTANKLEMKKYDGKLWKYRILSGATPICAANDTETIPKAYFRILLF